MAELGEELGERKRERKLVLGHIEINKKTKPPCLRLLLVFTKISQFLFELKTRPTAPKAIASTTKASSSTELIQSGEPSGR